MRVLQLLPSIRSDSGGPVRSTLASCRALHATDPCIRTTLATTDQGLSPAWEMSVRRRLPERMELRIFHGVGKHAFSFSPRLFSWLGSVAHEYDLWVIRACFHPISTMAAWMARHFGVPYVVVPHGTLSEYTFAHRRTLLKRTYFRLLEAHTLRGASAIRFTSEKERMEAPVIEGDSFPTIIPHPFDPPTELGSEHKPPDRANDCVLFLSRLHPKKQPELLLESFRCLLAAVPSAKLVMAGSGDLEYEFGIRRRVNQLGLGGRVELPGFVEGEEKQRLLRESTVFVLVSRQENFGVAAVEAMAAGLPVVLSRGVGIWREVREADAGIVLQEESPGALTSVLVELLNDPARRDQLGRNGRRFVSERYSLAVVGPALLELYQAAASLRCTEVLA